MVYRMLQHLYMQTYIVNLGQDEFWSLNDSWAKTPLQVHAQMYSLGDKYDLPGLKKEAARRFNEDVKISGDSKCETLTLLSVVPTVYEITLDSDRGLRDIVVRQIFQRYATASKHFVEELDTALEVRQFARDIIVLHRKKPPTKHAALIREMYWIWHYCVPRLQTVTVISPPTAAAFRARLLATGISLARLVWLFSVVHGVLALVSILKGLFEMLLGQSRGSRYDWARTW